MNTRIFLLVFICLQCHVQAQQTYYVKYDASGSNNGSNWLDAFTNIQNALQVSEYGDQIWVAKGTYVPTSDTDRNKSFLIPIGVSLWGGFAGVETSINERNIQNNKTILSGEIGNQSTRTDNSFHVIGILGGDSLTVIDGFSIVAGNADGQDAGGILSRNHGGGILIATNNLNKISKPIINNCFFEKNRGLYGGAIACRGNSEFACVPRISNCSFAYNRGEVLGASIYKEGINLLGEPFIIQNCISTKNYCQQVAGGFAIVNTSGLVRLKGCSFISDTGRLEVGGVYLETGNIRTRYEVDSCNFTANYSLNGCGGMTQLVSGFALDTVEVYISNTTFLLNHNFVGAGGGFTSYSFSKFQRINVERCNFSNNFSQNGGGGIWIEGENGCYSDVNVDQCFFLGNLTGAVSAAGAFYYRGSSIEPLKNKSVFSNSVFMFNSGALSCIGTVPGITDTRVVNCSFYRNGPVPFLKHWKPGLPSNYKSTMQILNSVIWEPEADGVARVFYNNDPSNLTVYDYFVDHSIINLSTCNFNGIDPCHEGMIYGVWPDFIDSSGQLGLIPWPNNPGVNKGSNAVVDTFNLLKDFEGTNRVNCDTVDIGAYEIQSSCNSSINEIIATQFPIDIRVLKNPVLRDESINFDILSVESQNITFKLHDINGRLFWYNNSRINAYLPQRFTINFENNNPGLFLLSVTDQKGKSYVQKILVY